MRIELNNKKTLTDKILVLSLTDENVNSSDFIELSFEGMVICVSVDELLSAIHAFEQKRCLENKEEYYKE